MTATASHRGAHQPFRWDDAWAWVDGLPGGTLNIAHEALHRHAQGPLAAKTALRWLPRLGPPVDLSYAEFSQAAGRFAAVLASLGVGRGDRVFSLMGRIPELYVTAMGTLHNGSVFCPLFSAFGPEPVRERLSRGDGRVLVTTEALYRRKVEPIRDRLPQLDHVLLCDDDGGAVAGTRSLSDLLATAPPTPPVALTRPEEMALLHFTSGTTGTPKGAVHVHEAVLAHVATARSALDLGEDDTYWCTADPGWVTGTSYGIVAPLVLGATMITDEAEFDARRWYRILGEQQVTVWYTAPTAIRRLMRADHGLAAGCDLSRLRVAASVGEPLNPEAIYWGRGALGITFLDNWWQTETGGIMIANTVNAPVKPGSMGQPLPGIEAAILRTEDDGEVSLDAGGHATLVDDPGEAGMLALRPGWPSMFRGYLHDDERYKRCFLDGWYVSGDLARRDGDGYFWFVGRSGDVIKSSGHLIGPFEVESALMSHPAVAEAGVVGIPDPVVGELVKAFVLLKEGVRPSEDLRLALLGHARSLLGPAVAPKEIAFAEDLPRTRSGKIMRRLLRARELGLPEGDTSTLEDR